MPGVDFRALRGVVSMAEVLDLLGFVGHACGAGQRRGRCPVHGSTTASSRCFAVHLGKNAFHCFKCGASGNQLDLWAAVTKQSIHAAAVDLCTRLGRDIPWIERW